MTANGKRISFQDIQKVVKFHDDAFTTLNILKSTKFYTLNGWYELYLKKVVFQKHYLMWTGQMCLANLVGRAGDLVNAGHQLETWEETDCSDHFLDWPRLVLLESRPRGSSDRNGDKSKELWLHMSTLDQEKWLNWIAISSPTIQFIAPTVCYSRPLNHLLNCNDTSQHTKIYLISPNFLHSNRGSAA